MLQRGVRTHPGRAILCRGETGGGGTCTAVEVDPCPAGDCNTCADHAQICVP